MASVTQTSGSQSETQFESNENSYYIEFYMEFSLWDGAMGLPTANFAPSWQLPANQKLC